MSFLVQHRLAIVREEQLPVSRLDGLQRRDDPLKVFRRGGKLRRQIRNEERCETLPNVGTHYLGRLEEFIHRRPNRVVRWRPDANSGRRREARAGGRLGAIVAVLVHDTVVVVDAVVVDRNRELPAGRPQTGAATSAVHGRRRRQRDGAGHGLLVVVAVLVHDTAVAVDAVVVVGHQKNTIRAGDGAAAGQAARPRDGAATVTAKNRDRAASGAAPDNAVRPRSGTPTGPTADINTVPCSATAAGPTAAARGRGPTGPAAGLATMPRDATATTPAAGSAAAARVRVPTGPAARLTANLTATPRSATATGFAASPAAAA